MSLDFVTLCGNHHPLTEYQDWIYLRQVCGLNLLFWFSIQKNRALNLWFNYGSPTYFAQIAKINFFCRCIKILKPKLLDYINVYTYWQQINLTLIFFIFLSNNTENYSHRFLFFLNKFQVLKKILNFTLKFYN